jgi:polyphosphate glucokinase
VIEVPSLSRGSYAGRPDPALAAAWAGFPLRDAVADRLGIPVRAVNDADMAGCAVVQGRGMEFVVTLGTGIGTALFQDGRLLPHLELSHLSFPGRRASIDILVGNSALRRIGPRRWRGRVHRMMDAYYVALFFDHAYLGGGNARLLEGTSMPPTWTLISNSQGLIGAVRVWDLDTE